MAGARRVIALTDGAAWRSLRAKRSTNKTIIAEHFPRAIRILDLYHAREHLADFAKDICRLPLKGPLHERWRSLLDEGAIENLLEEMRTRLPRSGPRRKAGLVQIRYFQENAPAMRYAEFREQGLFVGSGVIKAGCKTVIG